jgi:hypothetical protein
MQKSMPQSHFAQRIREFGLSDSEFFALFALPPIARGDDYLRQRAAELGTDLDTLHSQGIRADEAGNIRIPYFDEHGHAVYYTPKQAEIATGGPHVPQVRLNPFERIRKHPELIKQQVAYRNAICVLVVMLAEDPDGVISTFRAALRRLAEDEQVRAYWIHKRDELEAAAKGAGVLTLCFQRHDRELCAALATADAWRAHNLIFEFLELLARKYTPHEAAAKLRPPKVGKYTQPKGEGLIPYVPPITRSARRGRPLLFIEGELKALAAALAGLAAVAFPGINSYKVCDIIRAIILRLRPPVIYIGYDADGGEARRNHRGHITDERARNFGILSALKFAKEVFDFLNDAGIKCEVQLVVVRPDAPGKGIDDIMANVPNRADVVHDLTGAAESKYFHRIELKKSKLQKQVEEFFSLTNHRAFYERHRADIGLDPFIFGGAEYQAGDAGDLFRSVPFIRMNTDPFRIELPTEKLHLTEGQYLTNLAPQLDEIILANLITCLSSPPSSGKTTYAVRMALRTSLKVVIAAPTRPIANQYKKIKGVAVLSGAVSTKEITKALSARVIVCTYEHLGKVRDIAHRVLFVDEAHNLPRQFGTKGAYFRAETLREIVRYFPDQENPEDPRTAERVVLLSGTMPRTLPYMFGGALVEVTSDNAPLVNLNVLEALKKKDIRGMLATLLQRANVPGKVSFVLYNNCEEAEAHASFLVACGAYKEDEIAIINSPRYRSGEHEVFDYITRHEKTPPRIRLVICTCILAEGVNIKNKNIGDVFTVGTDHFLILQFVMRFRSMERVNLSAIFPPEKRTQAGFLLPASAEIDEGLEIAKTSVRLLQNRIDRRAEELAYQYGDCLNQVLSEEFSQPEASFRYAYIFKDPRTERPVPLVDPLQIIADVHRRQYEKGNNAYCISRLLETPGWNLADTGTGAIDESTAAHLQEAQTAIDEERDNVLEALRDQLCENADPVCNHLAKVYQEGRAREQVARMDELTAAVGIELSDDDTAAQVFALSDAGQAIAKGVKDARGTVLHFLELRRAGATIDEARGALDTWKRAELSDWTRAVNIARMREGKPGTEIQRFNLERLEYVLEAIAKEGTTAGTMTAKQIHEAGQRALSRMEAGKHGEIVYTKFDRITQAEALAMAKACFRIERTTHHREHHYRIGARWSLSELEAMARENRPLNYCQSVTPCGKPEKSVQRLTRKSI